MSMRLGMDPLGIQFGEHAAADCERELNAHPTFDRHSCLPEVFVCSCGRVWHHVCDESEGCFYTKEDDESHIVRGEE